MLRDLNLGDGHNLGTADGRIALDCSVRETAQGHFVISTTDFFFPLVDSPYLQGRIGAANVLSDLYAEGVLHCDFVLMLLAACRDMNESERTICVREMVRGFRDCCTEAGTVVTGGQTVMNPWPIIGGVATSVVDKHGFVKSDGAVEGHMVVLTKPLGTQVAVNVHQWQTTADSRRWKQCEALLSSEQAETMMHQAVCSMARINKNAGALMLKYGASAATDVTGFGILGHAQNLAENQINAVGIEIHTLPCIENTVAVNDNILNFRLTAGFSAETSGGLMVCLPDDKAAAYIEDLQQLDGCPAWIVGRVVPCESRKAKIVDDYRLIEV